MKAGNGCVTDWNGVRHDDRGPGCFDDQTCGDYLTMERLL